MTITWIVNKIFVKKYHLCWYINCYLFFNWKNLKFTTFKALKLNSSTFGVAGNFWNISWRCGTVGLIRKSQHASFWRRWFMVNQIWSGKIHKTGNGAVLARKTGSEKNKYLKTFKKSKTNRIKLNICTWHILRHLKHQHDGWNQSIVQDSRLRKVFLNMLKIKCVFLFSKFFGLKTVEYRKIFWKKDFIINYFDNFSLLRNNLQKLQHIIKKINRSSWFMVF